MPWLGISGGSERIAQRLVGLLREHYSDGRFCIIAPDRAFDLSIDARTPYGVPIVAFNDIGRPGDTLGSDIDENVRMELLDRLLIQYQPRTVHCLNSWIGWQMIKQRGRSYAAHSGIFGNIYSDVRLDGMPVGSFWNFLPDTIDWLSGVFADNETVVRKARDYFAFGRSEMARHFVIPTPILGLGGGDPAADLRPFQPVREPRSLWMSRIAKEKRMDVLEAIACAVPDRHFLVYGATIDGAFPVDLSGLRRCPNVDFRSHFEKLGDLPFDQVNSYVFTTSAEGLPIALLEAAQMGVPTVAPDVGGIGEFIDKSTGWLVSRSDAVDEYVAALAEMNGRPDLAAQRVAAAQARLLERHSLTHFAQTIRSIPGYLQ